MKKLLGLVFALALFVAAGSTQHALAYTRSSGNSASFDNGNVYIQMAEQWGYDGYSRVWDLSYGGNCYVSANYGWKYSQTHGFVNNGNWGTYYCNVTTVSPSGYVNHHYPRINVYANGTIMLTQWY